MRGVLLVAGFAGFIFGIASGSIFSFGLSLAALGGIVGVTLLLFQKYFQNSQAILAFSIFFFALTLGLARMELENYRYENRLATFSGEKVTIRGVISAVPDSREGSTKLTVSAKEISTPEIKVSLSEKISVTSGIYPIFHYGDEIELSGILGSVKNFSANGINFDYRRYLAKDGIFNEMVFPKISVLAENKGNIILEKLFSINESFSDGIRKNIAEPEASLALGELLGEKHAMSPDLLNDFKRAGIIHIVVLSGYNIALVSQFFIKIFSFLPLVLRSSFGGVAIVFFVLMTGGGASAIRAAIMALIALLGIATGRTYDAGRALFIAGFLMILENPNIILFDPSFQLSFLATLGLIYLTPLVFKVLRFVRPAVLRELVAQTIATQITVLPLLIYLSGQISLLALLVNILVLPAIPLAMLFSAATGFLGFLGHLAAVPFAFVSWLLLSYTISIAEFFSNLPFAVLSVGSTSIWFILFIYFILLSLFFLIHSDLNEIPQK